MKAFKYVIRDRELFTLAFVFFAISILSKVFGSSDVTAVSVGFSAGLAHFLFLASHFGAVALFISIRSSSIFRIPKSIMPYLLLALYATLSAFWSPSLLKSGGLATLSIFNVVWAVCITHSIRRFPSEQRFAFFMYFWAMLIVIDFAVELAFKGAFPNLDEYSMVAFLVASILFLNLHRRLAALLFAIGLSGQSLSAVLGLLVFWYCLLLRRRPVFGTLLLIALPLGLQQVWSSVLSGHLTIYGKNAELIITGSGRFNAWSAVVEAIASSQWTHFIFGHGYSSDRQALLAQELSWSVDVHNNVLHVFYGLGVTGILLLSAALFSSLRVKQTQTFAQYRFPILTSLFFFGLTSSYFFGRPSDMAIFWMSFLAVGTADKQINSA
jgi:hypothetical protein